MSVSDSNDDKRFVILRMSCFKLTPDSVLYLDRGHFSSELCADLITKRAHRNRGHDGHRSKIFRQAASRCCRCRTSEAGPDFDFNLDPIGPPVRSIQRIRFEFALDA